MHLRFVSFHEHVLNHVAGLLRVAEEQPAQPEQPPAVGVHEERLVSGPLVQWTGRPLSLSALLTDEPCTWLTGNVDLRMIVSRHATIVHGYAAE